MRRILIAVDGSECALKAVAYAAGQFSWSSDARITVLYVLPYLATSLWDDGHILTTQEREERKKVAQRWMETQRQKAGPLLQAAVETLRQGGIETDRIETKMISDSTDTADSILEETRNGNYRMLILGRCGHTGARRLLMGSVTTKILNHGAGTAICVVE
ncbi:MAG: universal stress protein [Nitrospirae bacterium]|nr:universal stress protein [Nitrospirota bacterium]